MITIVGLGAIGSHVAVSLRNAGPLRLVDFDRVEGKNTLAQFYGKPSVGRNKAQALAQSLQGLWGVKAELFSVKLTSLCTREVLSGSNLVLDCTDNIEARTVQQKFCQQNGIPLLHAAVSAGGDFARVMWSDRFVPDPESGTGATCENGDNLSFHLMVGAQTAQTALMWLRTARQRNFHLTPQSVSLI